jgi:uncharacterized protein involved in outer membrane biogenesis
MKRLRKLIIGLVGGVVLLVVILVVVVVLFLDSIARHGVEAAGSYALGVPTTLRSLSIGLLSGTVKMQEFKVANAPGFATDHFLTLGDGRVTVSLTSLPGDTIKVPEITLSNIDIALEKKDGKSNYEAILANLQKLSGPPSSQPPPPKEGTQKKLIIHELTIKNANVHADLLGAPGVIGAAGHVDVPIAEIRLTDIGQTGTGVAGSGVTVGELSGLVVQAVLSAALAKGGLPADFTGDLGAQLGKLGDLAGGAGKDVAKQASAAAEQIAKQAGAVGDQVGKEVGKQAEKLGDQLKGIIPGAGDKKK